jgi:hypothetical protein
VFHYKIVKAVMNAIFQNSECTIKAGPAREAACHGFGFVGGRNLRRAPQECHEDGPENSILVLQYEKEYLYAFFLEVALSWEHIK